MRLAGLLSALKDAPTKDLHLGAGTALTFLVRTSTYALVAVTGIVMARALGAHDRGVYSLVTTIALLFAAFSDLGISPAGIYLIGQKRCSLQEILSNNGAWLLMASAVWMGASIALGVLRPAFIPDDLQFAHFLIFALGGSSLLLVAFAKNLLIADGSVIGYSIIDFAEPFLRGVLILSGVLLFGLGLTGVLSGWVMAIVLAGSLAVYLVAKRGRLKPSLKLGLLRAQLSYGLRGYLGFVLQAANQRLDVFLVVAFVSSTALGHYAVAFGMAELLWQVPFALAIVFFPKVSALDSDANAETAATTCRRVLFITFVGMLGALATGRFLIGSLYGHEFLPAVTAFYILAPSPLLITIHKVLGSALSGRGMPEVGLYGGMVSLPVTVGLGLLLIPKMGIEGAALASMAAYATNAAVVLALFLWVTRRPIFDILLIKRTDILSSLRTARALLARSEA